MYNNYVVAGCGFVFIAATVIPWIYHIIHLMWRIIDDLEYVARNHGFFVRFFPKAFNKDYMFITHHDVDSEYLDAVAISYASLFGILFCIAGIAVFPILLYPVGIIGVIIGLIYGARGLRRLQKALREHVNDKEAHR